MKFNIARWFVPCLFLSSAHAADYIGSCRNVERTVTITKDRGAYHVAIAHLNGIPASDEWNEKRFSLNSKVKVTKITKGSLSGAFELQAVTLDPSSPGYHYPLWTLYVYPRDESTGAVFGGSQFQPTPHLMNCDAALYSKIQLKVSKSKLNAGSIN